jgi:cyclophilin family peptidyl-prolyl cis-trans isomerase
MARWTVIVLLWMAAMVQPGFTSNENGQERSNPMVVVETSEGTFKIELWADKAPVTVKNFLRYVDDGFYDGTIFHRVISDFMIQGGGLTPDMKEKKTRDAIKNEAAEELKNDRGTLAMARTNAIHSATSQFFINVVDNNFLNHQNKTPMGYGYAVFGKVVEGMDVVDKIRAVPTTTVGHFENVPATPVVITGIKRMQQE